MADRKNNGVQGAREGVYVEQPVYFITLTFGADVTVAATHTGFNLDNSLVDLALKRIGERATILGVGPIYNSGTQVDVMVGHATGWFLADTGGGAPNVAAGLVDLIDTYSEAVEQDRSGAQPWPDPIAATVNTVTAANFGMMSELTTVVAGDMEDVGGEWRPRDYRSQ